MNVHYLIKVIKKMLDCFLLAGKKYCPQDLVESLVLLRDPSEALICYTVRLEGVKTTAVNPDEEGGPRCLVPEVSAFLRTAISPRFRYQKCYTDFKGQIQLRCASMTVLLFQALSLSFLECVG